LTAFPREQDFDDSFIYRLRLNLDYLYAPGRRRSRRPGKPAGELTCTSLELRPLLSRISSCLIAGEPIPCNNSWSIGAWSGSSNDFIEDVWGDDVMYWSRLGFRRFPNDPTPLDLFIDSGLYWR
jgi:hypothetical protein